ncbi:MAG: hypothetical protein ACOC8F_06465 [Planctomycetota bacterium]
MATHLYLSMIPEALIASMLPPEQFGTYLATGTQKRSRGQAMFFELPEDFSSEHFDIPTGQRACTPHPDGTPKRSVYLAVYRVLERVPVSALGSLWLVTQDGRPLELTRGEMSESFKGRFHLYQEVCPVHPRVVSTMDPREFAAFITDPARHVSVPRICFCELGLGELGEDPDHGEVHDLPYPNIEHLRDCLRQLRNSEQKATKTVDRIQPQQFPYRCVQNGFFVSDPESLGYYPFPTAEQFETTYYDWWRSANV